MSDTALPRVQGSLAITAGTLLLAACGAGTAAAVSGGGDDGGSSNAPAAMSGFAVLDPKVPTQTRVRFVLADTESNTARVELFCQAPGEAVQPLTQAGSNPAVLTTSSAGVTHEIPWNFAAESALPDDAHFVEGVHVFARLDGGIQELVLGANAASVGLGNDPPAVTSVDAPAAEVSGIVLLPLVVSDSSNDVVSIRVEYDIVGDTPDTGWKPARPAQASGTPEYGIDSVLASKDGSPLAFFWDTNVDLADLEHDVRVRFTPTDFVNPGIAAASGPFRVDNNEEPVASIQEGAFIVSDDVRGGIPVPVTLIDEESDAIDLVLQWRIEDEDFPALPSSAAEVRSMLGDPVQRRALHVCSELPRSFEGSLIPVDPTHVRLPELADRASHVFASGLVGREIEFLRPPNWTELLSQRWRSNPLVHPIATTPLGEGLSALVLERLTDSEWRLREIELATGTVLRDIAQGTGTATAMTLERGDSAALIATHTAGEWRVSRTVLQSSATAEVAVWNDPLEQGPIRGMASVGSGVALVTVGSSLVRLDYTDPSAKQATALFDDLATPWGVARDPLRPDSVYLAEKDVPASFAHGRIVRVELPTLRIAPVLATPILISPAIPFPAPESIAIDSSNRLLALCRFSLFETRGLDLDSRGEKQVFSLNATSEPIPADSISTGGHGLQIWAESDTARVWVVGGLEARRTITAVDPATQIVTLNEPLPLPLGTRRSWRVALPFEASSGPAGATNMFVWDSSDVTSASVYLRATPLDAEIGLPSSMSAARRVMGPLEYDEWELLAAFEPGAVVIDTTDLDGDDDMDLIVQRANLAIELRFQSASGTFDAQLPVILGGGRPYFPTRVLVADLNDDSRLDILIQNATGFGASDELLVYPQIGFGGFATTPFVLGGPGVTDNPSQVSVVDLDRDGRNDVLVKHGITGRAGTGVTVLTQGAPGVFVPKRLELPIADEDVSGFFEPIDVDGDGVLELWTTTWTHQVALFRQSAQGGFGAPPVLFGMPQDGGSFGSPLWGDFEGDGDQDLLWARESLQVYVQLSPGIFAERQLELLELPNASHFLQDIDSDGDHDLVSLDGGRMAVYRQSSPGDYDASPFDFATGFSTGGSLWFYDFDRDGHLDLLSPAGGELRIARQHRPGTFGGGPTAVGGFDSIFGNRVVSCADMDGDGDLDLVAANRIGHNIRIYFQTAARRFAPIPLVLGGPGVLNRPRTTSVADLDGDGDQDVVSGNEDRTIKAFFQSGSGAFDAAPTVLWSGGSLDVPQQVVAVDVDGDGDRDIVAALVSSTLLVFFQTSPGQFASSPLVLGGPTLTSDASFVEAVDFDLDGDLDLVTKHAPFTLVGFAQTSVGAFEPVPTPLGSGSAMAAGGGDLDGDGDGDIAFTDGGMLRLLYTTPGIFYPATSGLTVTTGLQGLPSDIEVCDVDGDRDGDLISINGSNITFFSQTSPGFLEQRATVLGSPSSLLGARSVACADLDGDGDVDMVAANEGTSHLTVFWGGD